MIDEAKVRRVKEKIAMLEEIFVEIRDHPKTPAKIRGIADFGQGRVENLKNYVASVFAKERS